MQRHARGRSISEEEIVQRCREAGLKVTPQRIAIYRALVESEDHPSPELLFERVRDRIPGLSLGTIYKTLDQLEQARLVSQVSVVGEVKRYDGNQERHHHLVCTECKRISDCSDPSLDAIDPPRRLNGFLPKEVQVQINGVCAECQKGNGKKKWQS